jgi:plasmid maintenance system antidote protein VapI
MNQKEFAKKVLKISPTTWCQVLKGQRNLGNDNAEKVSVILASAKDIWRNPRLAEYRILAWKKFSGEQQ